MPEARLPGTGSLRGRLLWRLGAMLLVLLLLGSVATYWRARHASDIAYDRTLLASARDIASGLYDSNGALRANVPYVALDSFAYDSAGRIFYQVIDTQGQSISGYENLPPPPPGTPRTNDYPALARFYDAEFQGQDVRVVSLAQPVSQPTVNGMAEIRVAETLGARERLARDLLADTLLNLALSALAALAMVWYAVSAGLRPLDRLRAAVEERQPDDLRPLPLVRVQRELRPLVAALNHFTARLLGLFERQSHFIADASHELRTPLAALKARLELGLREDDPQRWRATLEEAVQYTDKVTGLANQLLSLARIESGARAIAEGGGELIELGQLAREQGMVLAPLAHARGIELAFEADSAAWIKGDPTLLHELLANLVDNALAHAASSVVIRVGPAAVLEVEDDGPGIPLEERDKVFQRFYRRRQQGTGLGLAIVGEICSAHRARIELAHGELGGLLVRVNFPVEEPARAE
ncbi:integral membrane sensor signal transduction histidine kinase [Pseudomonas knackmussii B13]|uniref:histidine kinase n=1 Tax=Pseudomonas knackmussii (strain DSM 6978 / CCUG 54928 / LMG 23759 / B13) TaxID=1301098 RepID=A0A024HE29_PSEKB|nr:integral membrane sensor signal transduction histidine kinase [Pseudomonas knackmussii B13]